MNRAFSADGLALPHSWGGAPGFYNVAPLALNAYLAAELPGNRAWKSAAAKTSQAFSVAMCFEI
jgi:hypothetical protein